MAVSIYDNRLLDGYERALERLRELEVGERTTPIVQIAGLVLEESFDEYRRAMEREHIKDLLTGEAGELVSESGSRVSDAMVRVYYALQRKYAERRAEGKPLNERDRRVEEFLSNVRPPDYVSKSLPNAASALEKALSFASQNLPEDVQKYSDMALEKANEARGRLEEVSSNALKALSDLEKARDEAKKNYLAARELVSAALRLEERHEELNDFVPPVTEVLSAS